MWAAIQSFVFATGVVSALLWPPKPSAKSKFETWQRREARAKSLRTRLHLSDSSALNDRLLRHHFAHVDERIHDWADVLQPRGYVEPDAFRTPHHVGLEQDWPNTTLRNFDQFRWLLTFAGETFDLDGLAKDVTFLTPRVRPLAFNPFQGNDIHWGLEESNWQKDWEL